MREREALGVGGNTIRLDIAVISRVFNLARTTWGFESIGNPTEKVERPKVNRGRERRLAPGEKEALLTAASEKLRLCIEFALETAMRREEIASLSWENVNMAKKTALLPKTKNGEQRTVPLSPRALEILETMGPKGEGNVFGISAGAITRPWRPPARKPGSRSCTSTTSGTRRPAGCSRTPTWI